MRPWGFGSARTKKPQNSAKFDPKKPIFEQFLDPSTPKIPGLHLEAAKLSSVDPPWSLGTIEYSGCGMLVKILMN